MSSPTHDSSGTILILGHEVKGSKPFTGKIGFLFLSHGFTSWSRQYDISYVERVH